MKALCLATEMKETARCAYELMARAEAIDRKLSEAGGAERDCELGEITRMRQQIGRMTAAAEANDVQGLTDQLNAAKTMLLAEQAKVQICARALNFAEVALTSRSSYPMRYFGGDLVDAPTAVRLALAAVSS